jgi:hypothetical protein
MAQGLRIASLFLVSLKWGTLQIAYKEIALNQLSFFLKKTC